MRSWELKGSNDNDNWITIHEKTNTDELLNTNTYKIEKEFPPFSYFMLEMSQPIVDTNNNWTMRVRHFDLFGDVVKIHPQTCSLEKNFSYLYYIITLMIIYQ